MIYNSIAVFIDGRNLTRYAVMPIKWANLLDEQLDEGVISLRNCPKKVISPLTPIEIRITNKVILKKGSQPVYTHSRTLYMIAADQPDSNENPVGSGRYDHDIRVIEVTKLLERTVVDSITYTNVIGKVFTANPTAAPLTVSYPAGSRESDFNNYYKGQPASLITPVQDGSQISVPSYINLWTMPSGVGSRWTNISVAVYNEGGTQIAHTTSSTTGLSVILPTAGSYTVVYNGSYAYDGATTTITRPFPTLTFTILVVENQLPLKKWTIKDVINRLLDVAEPIRKGESARFTLNAERAALFDNILAPQFSFTKQTLRECLQEIGGVVHGEPRLTVKNDGGGWYYEISYDMYGGTEISGIAARPYVTGTVSRGIEAFCTSVDTSAENLINALGESMGSYVSGGGGVITEPYEGGFKTVRCDTLYVRISEENMLIPTTLPIYSIESLECGIIPNNESVGTLFDITDYVFESSQYNTRLSSYSSGYPYSKAYGLMYTQGQKNVTALNFKPDNPVSPVFENYAIINILREVSGQDINVTDYALLAFRIKYTPIYSARVSQTKVNYKDFSRGSVLIYNQGSNVIESRYYGENLKGLIARLGNVEMTRTYHLSRLGLVPKAGQKYNAEYYISAVNTQLFPNAISVTVALSKDFNRLSQYVGISSAKRFSEVSQTQALERNVLYREYIAIGDSETADADCYTGDNLMEAVRATFTQTGDFAPLTNVVAWGESAQGNETPAVQLPVICSSFGNSISFGWAYEDNYSAGAISEYAENEDTGVNGYFQNNYRYTDYYGRMYYYNFDLQRAGATPQNFDEQTQIGTSLPAYTGELPTASSGYFSTVGQQPHKLRKDNREIISVNAQIDFVTNRKGMIIGSALASNNPLVSGMGLQAAKLYVFTQTLDKFINHLSGSIDIDFNSQTVDGKVIQTPDLPDAELVLSQVSGGAFSLQTEGGTLPGAAGTQYKAWAIVTPQLSQSEEVEDEEGNQTTQTVQYGGDVLLAQNMDFSAGDTFPPIYFTKKREVFDKSVWTTAR